MNEASLGETVGYQLVRAAKAHRHHLGSALEDLDLHVGQELTIVVLSETDGLRQSELAERLNVEPPTVTKTVQNLEEAGLVERSPDPDDARAQRVVLTERGDDLIEDITKTWMGVEEPMLDGFTDEERILLRRMLVDIHVNLRELAPDR